MPSRIFPLTVIVGASLLAGCGDAALEPHRTDGLSVDPGRYQGASSSLNGNDLAATLINSPSTVLVNPHIGKNGAAPVSHGIDMVATINEGIAMVGSGGRVLLLPGTYNERVIINKGLTLEPFAGPSPPAPVIIKQSLQSSALAREGVILIETTEPVVIRDLTVRQDNIRGINALFRGVNLTVEGVSFEGISDISPIVGNGVTVTNNAGLSGGRATLVVRDSRFSVGGIGIVVGGDVDAELVANQVQHVRSRSVCVIVNPTGQGAGATVPAGTATNVEIRDNLFENCGTDALRFPGRGFNAIAVQGAAGAPTTGTISIINNTFHTSAAVPGAPDACPTSAILFEFYSGVIEHNSLINVVPACAVTGPRNSPGAIYVGSRVAGIRAAGPVRVRFNDIAGNEFAGLRIGSNQPTSFDATCNWWGDPSGPSGAGSGSGDAVLIDVEGAVPTFTPFATGPIAGMGENSC